MSLTLNSAVRFNTDLSLEIRPDSLDGLIVHFGQSRDARFDFLITTIKLNWSTNKVHFSDIVISFLLCFEMQLWYLASVLVGPEEASPTH